MTWPTNSYRISLAILDEGGILASRGLTFNLSGTVKHLGLPVAGTTIVLYDYWSTGSGLTRHFLAEQVTQQKGDFSFDVRKGTYSLDVIPNRETRFTRQCVETIKVASNTVLSFSLKNGSLISGAVTKSDGEALKFCQLQFLSRENEPIGAVETADEEGRFSISLPRATYQVVYRANPAGAGAKHGAEPFLCTTTGALDVEGDRRDLDLVLVPLVSFKGAVTDERGHPVSGVVVTIRPSQSEGSQVSRPAPMAVCRSSKIGQFECAVEPGLYDVKLEPEVDSHLSQRQINSILIDQARTRTLSLGPGYKLFGRVEFEGRPIKDCLITISGGKTESSALTDADGQYAITMPGGAYEMIALVQPDSLARMPFKMPAPYSCAINLTEDTCKNVALQEGVQLSGHIIDAQGNPRPGVQVALYKDTGKQLDTTSGAQRPIAFCITGDDGSYDFRLPVGKLWVVINNQQSTARVVEAASDDLEIDVIWDTGCIVEFAIVSEFDSPIAGCKAYCELYGTTPGQGAKPQRSTSNDAGICRFAVPAGIYTFRFEPSEQGGHESKTIRQLSVNSDTRRKVRLASKTAATEAR